MIKTCGNSIYKQLQLNLRSCLKTGNYGLDGKKLMLFPFFRKLINKVRKITIELISSHQSGFKLVDSCINHLFPINCESYKSFDDG